ncbi:transforming growth factor-beta-induced protein [Elysia marginata]|uniref:Transforming growth factor-beta-induced protein n=1 Tax=Elysia marginata TaxID=1093978 RepID=A0AAV4GNV0_9GAST|nr:transforming growth factor-beta-induced protein [Elysia marginata]
MLSKRKHDRNGERKIEILYECCKGFERQKGDDGCPRRVEMRDLVTLAEQIGLNDFLQAARRVGLDRELASREVTVFAPVDGAFGGIPDIEVVGPPVVLQVCIAKRHYKFNIKENKLLG